MPPISNTFVYFGFCLGDNVLWIGKEAQVQGVPLFMAHVASELLSE
jgi:hypothetical protein